MGEDAIKIGEWIVGMVTVQLDAFVNEGLQAVADALNQPFVGGFGVLDFFLLLWVAWLSFRLISNQLEAPVAEVMQKVVLVGITAALVLHPSLLAGVFYKGLPAIGDLVGQAVIPGQQRTIVGAVDDLVEQSWLLAQRYQQQYGGFGTATLIASFWSLICILVSMFFLVIVVVVFVISQAMLALLVLLLPVFLLAMLFPSTRGLFSNWLGSVLNYVLIPVMTALVVGLIAAPFGALSASLLDGGGIRWNDLLMVVVMSLVGIALMGVVFSVASALGGGIAFGVRPAISGAGSAVRGMVMASGVGMAASRIGIGMARRGGGA